MRETRSNSTPVPMGRRVAACLRGATILLAATLASGCTTGGTLRMPNVDQEDVRANLREQWQGFFDKEAHLEDIAWEIKHANAQLCPNIVRRAGFSYLSRDIYRQAMKNRVFRYPLPRHLGKEWEVVQTVASGSPAEEAGLRPGDVYRNIAEPVKTTYRQRRRGKIPERADLILEVRREAVLDTVIVNRVFACDVTVGILKNASVNAATDGSFIGVTDGLIEYVESDDELAFIFAHELAHVALDHIGKMQGNALKRGLLGVLADALVGCTYCNTGEKMAASGAVAHSVEFETEADYLGAYMTARAGFDPTQGGVLFARMMATSTTPSVWSTSHPVDAARELNVALYAQEIATKQLAGEQLLPNKRSN